MINKRYQYAVVLILVICGFFFSSIFNQLKANPPNLYENVFGDKQPVVKYDRRNIPNFINFILDAFPGAETKNISPGGSSNDSIPSTGSDFDPTACDTVSGNDKIVCAAIQFLGIRYANNNSAEGLAKYTQHWGVKPQGLFGHPPRLWLDTREPEGPTDFLECSGFTDLAIYIAFGVNLWHCSADYLRDKTYFQIISPSEMQSGDFFIKSPSCGDNGHVGIFVRRQNNTEMLTLESSWGVNIDGERRSGYYIRKISDYPYAVRYIGPGSTTAIGTN